MDIIILVLLVLSVLLNVKFILDLSKNKKEINKLEELVTIDRITKVNNKYKIELILEEQIFISKRYDRHLCLIQFALDEGNSLRQKLGNNIYDEILKSLVALVLKEVRLSDVVGRWNDQEFCIVLPETSMIHAVMLAEKLRQKIEIYQFETADNITASFGITILNEKDQIQTLVSRAQSALNKAKEGGVNKIEVL